MNCEVCNEKWYIFMIYQLLDKVDEGRITPTAGAELSFLDTKHQAILNDYLEK